MEATSERGLLGNLMTLSCGGELESRDRGKSLETGELKEVGGAESEEYRDTGGVDGWESDQQTHA